MGQQLTKPTTNSFYSPLLQKNNPNHKFLTFQKNLPKGLSAFKFPTVNEASQFLAVAQSQLTSNTDAATVERVSTICEALTGLVGDPNVQEAIATTDAFQSLQEMFVSEQLGSNVEGKIAFPLEGKALPSPSVLGSSTNFAHHISLCSKCSNQIHEEKTSPFDDASSYSGGHVGNLPPRTNSEYLQKVVVPLTVLTVIATSVYLYVKPSLALQFFKAGWNFFMKEWSNLRANMAPFGAALSIATPSFGSTH